MNQHQPALDQKYIDEMHAAIKDCQEKMQKLCNGVVISGLGEHVAMANLANLAITSTVKIVETETLQLMDAMSLAFDETSGAIKKLRDANEKVSKESAFIVSSLKDVQRKTVEVSAYANELERLNGAMDKLKQHIDSGLFDVAAKCANAIGG